MGLLGPGQLCPLSLQGHPHGPEALVQSLELSF